jgi:threonylcarbamoyladenosine tRNA methylthiotransferase MtaB
VSDPVLVTFGCRLNTFESEVMRRHAREAGLEDAVIVHTCAVTAEAERQARQAIRRARRQHPGARIVVTGCAAQIDPGRWSAMPEVDHVVGNHDKLRPETWRTLASASAARMLVSDVLQLRALAAHMVEGFDGRTRAFVQVQQGCDHRCTFCIIPRGRGQSRSLPVDGVVAQTRRLVEAGYREVVLTGVDLTSYGRDLPDRPPLGRLVRRILREVPELPRLRLSSVDPAEVDDELRAAFAEEERLMPHLHLSVQAGDDLVLKRMKRRHLRADVLRLVRELRALRPDLAFGADLIAGFPTESEEMFANTLALVEEADLVFLHVFPYSARPGTPAARMPQVPVAVRRERATRLRALGEERLARFLRGQIGAVCSLLVERDGSGHTEHFARARLDPPGVVERGRIVPVRVLDADGGSLIVRAEA